MIGNNEKNYKLVVMVQDLLRSDYKSGIPPVFVITEKIDLVLNLFHDFNDGTDVEWVKNEVIDRLGVWQSESSSIINTEGHFAWLKQERKKDWQYWNRYRLFQEKALPWKAVEEIDKSTDKILGLLEDPKRDGKWDRRGMVVGHVQSGKTGSYTGLICKAADAGYKIIIVLAGLHNNLRSQTQMRLDEGFLGYETSPDASNVMNIIGVGNIDNNPDIRPNYVTNRTDKGDFNTKAANNLGITPEQRPWLFVVKKNKSVLTNLNKWIAKHVANKFDTETGRKIVSNLPLLIIDDEADNASVDTGKQAYTEDGKPDDEHSPTAINSLIRQILNAFERKAYVGYTATPFANIFIYERNSTKKEGPDLFPDAFIYTLGAPSNYVGPSKVFGLGNGDEREGALPLIRTVADHCSKDERSGWMPPKHKKDHHPRGESECDMPESLVEAINSFLLACTIRDLRGQSDNHNSMLIHVTRLTNVQGRVRDQVDSYIRYINQHLSRRIGGHVDILSNLKQLWENDFKVTTNKMHECNPENENFLNSSWEEIEALLPDVVNQIIVKEINGTAKDALDYVDSAEGLKIIAIGGDKLSRGLTLEGLCVSYFLRTTKMYDTLMQMGRWFGYRDKYLDLTRLYVTNDLVEWFEHITDAAEELRDEFELMESSGATPREYGLKVKSHPVLMVTSQIKMRTAKSLYLSFSGTVSETVAFNITPDVHKANNKAFRSLLTEMGSPGGLPSNSHSSKDKNLACWQQIPSAQIIDFLGSYSTHPDSPKVNSSLLKEFVSAMNKKGELTEWTVILQGGSGRQSDFGDLLHERNINLSDRKNQSKENKEKYSIKRLLGSTDEDLDLTEKQWNTALQLTIKSSKKQGKEKIPTNPNGPSIRRVKGFGANGITGHPERGLLLLTLLDPQTEKAGKLSLDKPIVAFGISFPGSNSGVQVEYKANNILWKGEYDVSG
ncbi:MAG: hypothetical protein ACI9L9_000392 [Marivirga sp.]|jgi:hypothetical protein